MRSMMMVYFNLNLKKWQFGTLRRDISACRVCTEKNKNSFNILETSTDSFYIKIVRFADFFRVQIHSWNANVS